MTFDIRPAVADDADAIADAHRHSIETLGPRFYPAAVVRDWAALVRSDIYLEAISSGERFFIAVASGGAGGVLGFSSHRNDGGVHGVAVYVRGDAARQGVGSALLRAAEASAAAAGATRLAIDASLAAVAFYGAHGFVETGRGTHPLAHGRSMACVFMRKDLGGSPISASRATRRPSGR